MHEDSAGDADVLFGSLDLSGDRSAAMTASPPGGSDRHVIVLPGIHGRTPHVLDVCRRLVAGGHRAVVADFYCTAAQRGEIRGPADVASAVAALDDAAIADGVAELADSLAPGGPVAVLGYCIGGTLGLLATSRSDAVTATVAYYGVLRHRGPLAEKGPDPLDSVGDTTVPVLAHYGTVDPWCSEQDVDDLEAKLAASGGAHGVYRYPGAGHAFEEPGSRGFRPVAAGESARRTADFLDYYLTGPGVPTR
ncbi:MAG: dienelactone hydrolase family protein [Actinomycetes bacterium]